MAKSKAKSKLQVDEDLPEEIADEEPDVEEEPADVDAEEEPAPDAAEEEPEDDVPALPKPPKPRLTKTAIVLILLNWIMAPAFLTVAYMDHMVRSQYSYRTLLNYVAIWGLPLKSEEDAQSLANETRPRLMLTSDQIKSVLKLRPGAKIPSEQFVPVDEPITYHLRPSDMIDELTVDIFGPLPDKVKTLDDEIERLQKKLPADIDAVADEVLKKTPEDKKRELVEKVLLPLAADVWQVKNMDKLLTNAKGAELDDLLKQSIERRLYYDILAPLNVYRPGDIKKFDIERIAEVVEEPQGQFKFKRKLEEIKELMQNRLKSAIADKYDVNTHLGKDWTDQLVNPDANNRDSIEKRQVISFLLFTLGQVQKPTLGEPLYKKGVERAETICGLHEFTNAAIHYVLALRTLESRIVDAIKEDRDGNIAMLNKEPWQLPGFAAEYEGQIDRMVRVAATLDVAKKRLDDLKMEKDKFQAIFDQRTKHHADTKDKLLKARKNTEKSMQDLLKRQTELHDALVELSEAAAVNFRLLDEITAIERPFIERENAKNKKGGKKQP